MRRLLVLNALLRHAVDSMNGMRHVRDPRDATRSGWEDGDTRLLRGHVQGALLMSTTAHWPLAASARSLGGMDGGRAAARTRFGRNVSGERHGESARAYGERACRLLD